MSLFFLIRTDLKKAGLETKLKESELKKCADLKGSSPEDPSHR